MHEINNKILLSFNFSNFVLVKRNEHWALLILKLCPFDYYACLSIHEYVGVCASAGVCVNVVLLAVSAFLCPSFEVPHKQVTRSDMAACLVDARY